jgi:5-methyltetrahydropteroyltriglutamate--homocysteine methyltransferase
MERNIGRIAVTHAGSLPRPDALIELNRRRGDHAAPEEERYQQALHAATADVVRRQIGAGIDLPNDGEYGHAMGSPVDYGAWWSYSFQRLGGLGRLDDVTGIPSRPARSGLQLRSMSERRDRRLFRDAYADPEAGIATAALRAQIPVCDGPLSYIGHAELRRDIDNLKAAIGAAGVETAFMCALGPGSASRIGNEYYDTEEEFIWACAEALREEYLAITEAGLIVQIDEPSFAENWDRFDPAPSLEGYRAFTRVRIDALNHALRGISPESVRFHCCWGSWHGPHTTDIGLEALLDLLLEIDAGSFSFEAANVRHEHEWRLWKGVDLGGRVLVPGVVSHATNVIEHPEVVADRIVRFASAVGRENVIAATDCGLGGRVHPQIAWAKLKALADGATIATRRLWS